MGDPSNLKMAFQTLTLLDSSLNPTPEEMQYYYDSTGRLLDACFAQTPAAGYNPGTGNDWYPMGSNYASSRCRASYDYDPAGRVRSVYHYWDTWNTGTSSYNTSNIVGNTCEYEFTGLDRGLKTESDYYNGNRSNWTNYSTETYGYDANLDYLTSAAYTDGGSASWTYDAAGNRTDSVVDNLNRTTSISGQSTSCDILGNRLTLGSNVSYGWDCLNRMASYTSSGVSNSYWYRADGMRVAKLVGSTGTTTMYRYDGQMGFEDVDTAGSGTTVTDYGIGARGIDYISANSGSGANVGFPLYDGHGNMIGTLARSGQGSYTTGNVRGYDAWGSVRSGQTTGDPKSRYCAKAAHKQDDESGLIYMRARYYEPGSGRFLSEDPSMQGTNWMTYCNNRPTTGLDVTGKEYLTDIYATFDEFLAELAVWPGPVGNFLWRAQQFFDSMIALGMMAFTDAFRLFNLASGAPSLETSQMLRAQGARYFAEGIVAVCCLIQMQMALYMRMVDDDNTFGPIDSMGSG